MENYTNVILNGNSLELLKTLPDQCVQTCITSPPYWGLRDYGTATWIGGDKNCTHRRESKKSDKTITGHKNFTEMLGVGDAIYKNVCNRCGAVRKDDQLGLEETPEQYVENMVLLFREVRRVLKDDGTLWLNLGDSYAGGAGRWGSKENITGFQSTNKGSLTQIDVAKKWKHDIIKPKDLVGIPWRVAFALQADGWYLRQDIIWHKPNPMPESVTDRCTKSHEYIFLMTKSAQYYYDHEAIMEKTTDSYQGKRGKLKHRNKTQSAMGDRVFNVEYTPEMTRNKRSVWTIPTRSYKEAHFAVFPDELIKPCILAGSAKGDIVLDPFFGSGTTGLVALRSRRRFIGIELNSEYISIANKRLKPYLLQNELF